MKRTFFAPVNLPLVIAMMTILTANCPFVLSEEPSLAGTRVPEAVPPVVPKMLKCAVIQNGRELKPGHSPVLTKDSQIRLHYSVGANLLCKSLRMDFSKCSYVPSVITAKATDNGYNIVYRDLFSITGNTSPVVDIPVNKPFSFILIEMSKFRNDCAVFNIAPECSFRFDPEQVRKLAEDRELHKKIILAADDPANPLSIIRQPITEYYRHLASELIRKSGKKAPTDFEKVMIFVDYISRFEAGNTSDTTPFGSLQEKIGFCCAVSYALNALSAANGIPCRIVQLYNYPAKNSSHCVTEQLIDGKWRVFDATYGLYYKNAKIGEIMSFGELCNPAYVAVPVYLEQKKEEYDISGEKFGTQNLYLHSDPAGVIGLDKPMFFPQTLCWPKNATVIPPAPNYLCADWIGVSGGNIQHEWRIEGLAPGKNYRFTITPRVIGGDLGDPHFVFTAQAGKQPGKTFKLHRDRLQPVHLDFTAESPKMKIRLTHSYRGPKFHYLYFKKISLSER